LIEAVEHHVEEEEGEMFPKLREVFEEDELEQLGQALESAKGIQSRQAV
jgi:hemerythrin superfamily protein